MAFYQVAAELNRPFLGRRDHPDSELAWNGAQNLRLRCEPDAENSSAVIPSQFRSHPLTSLEIEGMSIVFVQQK